MNRTKAGSELERGLEYLEHVQLPSGEIPLETSNDPEMVNGVEPVNNNFATAYAVDSLRSAGVSEQHIVLRRAMAFVAASLEPSGLARFWQGSGGFMVPMPPDVDTTSVVSSVLCDAGRRPDNRTLLLKNRTDEGAFYVWMLPRWRSHGWRIPRSLLREWLFLLPHPLWRRSEARPDDVDWGVIANVVAWLGEDDETRSAINSVINIIEEGKESTCDRWYLNPITCYYLISRAFRRGVRSWDSLGGPIAERLWKPMNADTLDELETALSILTLLNFGAAPRLAARQADKLIELQGSDGSWARNVFFWGGPSRIRAFGSAAVTTSFACEAIARARAL